MFECQELLSRKIDERAKKRKREKRNIRLLEIIDPTVAKAKFKKNLKIRACSPEVPLLDTI